MCHVQHSWYQGPLFKIDICNSNTEIVQLYYTHHPYSVLMARGDIIPQEQSRMIKCPTFPVYRYVSLMECFREQQNTALKNLNFEGFQTIP